MTKYKKGRMVTGIVTGIERYGIFVYIDNLYTGLIHISEISNGFVKNIHEFVNVGETIYARIIEVDNDFCQLKLSIKDVDYRSKCRGHQKIVETSKGFQPLCDCLDGWITQKLEEIEKN